MRLIQRKEKWVLTIHGWLFSLVVFVSLIGFLLTHLHSFLAPNSPIQADILVVEGWIQDYAIKDALKEFNQGSYQKIITTGVPIEQGYYLVEYKNFANLAAATLIALGFDQDKLVVVPAADVVRNRTVASAAALRQWIEGSDLKIKSMNLYTFDVHARRSWLIFQQTLAPKIKVGVIAAKPLSYNPKQWWVSSEGVRSVTSELIAYIYAQFVNWKT